MNVNEDAFPAPRPAVGDGTPCSVEPLESRRMLSASSLRHAAAALPHYDHIVVAVEEDRDYAQMFGDVLSPPALAAVIPPSMLNQDGFIRSLAAHGASFTNASGELSPRQGAYLVLFSGSTQGTKGNVAPVGHPFAAQSVGGQVLAHGMTFAGYAEGLPYAGFRGHSSGQFAARHSPWVSFADVPASSNLPFSAFPSDYSKLPALSFVSPNLVHDMHSGTIGAADAWLQQNLGGYARWATAHNSLLIVTWDEGRTGNHIPTVFYGAHVTRGDTAEPLNHYRLLSTIDALMRLPALAGAAAVAPVTSVFATG